MHRGSAVVCTWFLGTAVLASGQTVFEKRISPVNANETASFQRHVRAALLVGVSKYPASSGFSALNYAAADAQDLAAVLKQQGYLVRVLADGEAMRGPIEHSLRELGEMVDGEQGTFLFYFSGHGYSQKGKNYLVPISASIDTLERDGLAVDDVEQLMAKSKARRQLMLLDACRSDEGAGTKGSDARSFSAFQAAEGFRILNSTRLGKVSYESPDLRHGVFTAFLLKGLQGDAAGKDGLVTFRDLADYVTDSVRSWSSDHNKLQIPYEAVGAKEASGDFLLARLAVNASVPTLAAPTASPTTDLDRYTAALRTHDPAVMEAEAGKISNPTLADTLRRYAQMYKNQGGSPLPGRPSLSPARNSDADPISVRKAADAAFRRKAYYEALPLYRQLADAGDASAMTAIGTMYETGGNGLPMDVNQAAQWQLKAAEAGNSDGMRTIGLDYFAGVGVPKDYDKAAFWLRKAADAGQPMAMGALGVLYRYGRGVPKDVNQAVFWLRKAAATGDPNAQQQLRELGASR